MNRKFFRIGLLLTFLALVISLPDFDWRGGCRLVISELKFNYKAEDERKVEFIELAKVCNEKPRQESAVSVNKFHLVFINGLTQKIVMVCSLNGNTFESGTTEELTYLFLVGTGNVPLVSMPISDCKTSEEDKNSFPKATSSPIGIALLKLDRVDPKFLEINNEPMSGGLIQQFKKYMRDFYVYEQNNKPRLCGLFDHFYDGEQTRYKNALFRVYQTNNKAHDFSLNRCKAGTDPFHNKLFLSKPSPGELNVCNEGFEFNLIDIIDKVVLNNNLRAMLSVKSSKYTTCHNYGFQFPEYILDEGVDAEYTYLHKQSIAKSLPNGVKTWKEIRCENIPQNWLTSIKQNLSPIVRVQDLLRPDTCSWFDYVFDPISPAYSPVTCSLCKDLKTKNVLKEKRDSDVWDKATLDSCGLLGHEKLHWNTKKANWEAIKRHNESPAHQIALQIKEADRLGLQGEERKVFLENEQGAYYKFYGPTLRFLNVIYSTIKARVPFNSFPYFAELMEKLEVNVGRLHQTRWGAKAATMFLSEQMHKELLAHLKSTKPKFSLVVDSSVERSGVDNLVALLHVVYPDMTVKTKFYKFVTLEGTSGLAMFTKLKESIEADGLGDFFKDSMIGLTTDGAKNMKNTFKDEFVKWANTDLNPQEKHYYIHIWCNAHRIQLTIKHALEHFPFIQDVDSTINDLYVVFNNIHQKNIGELKKMQVKFKVPQFSMKKDYPIRWVASKRRCVATVLDYWHVIANTLRNMNLDTTKYLASALAKYSSMYLRITDKAHLLHLAFFGDVADLYTIASEAFQRKDVTIVDQTRIVDNLSNGIIKLAQSNGERLKKLLKDSTCYTDDESAVEACEVKHFEKVGKVQLHGITIVLRNINSPKLSENRNKYLQAILEEIRSYFSPVMEQNFKILEPTQLRLWISSDEIDVIAPDPTDESNVVTLQMPGATYAKEALERLNRWFKWSPPRARVEQLFREFENLIKVVTTTPEYRNMKTKGSAEFWKFYFNYPKAAVKDAFTPHLIQAIQTCLAVAAASASAERYFSLYNHVKTSQRYNLAASTVDALVRVAHNEDVTIKTFDGFKYATLWTEKYARTDDSKYIRTSKDPQDKENDGWFDVDQEIPIDAEDQILFGDDDDVPHFQQTSELPPQVESLIDDFNITGEDHFSVPELVFCAFFIMMILIICVLVIKAGMSRNNRHQRPTFNEEEELQFISRQPQNQLQANSTGV